MEHAITGDPEAAAKTLTRYLQRGGSDVLGSDALNNTLRSLTELETEFAATVSLPNEIEADTADAASATGDHQGDTPNENDAEDDDDDDDAASDVSETSTVEYEHDPFDTYQEHVMTLAQVTVWPGASSDEIEVERMKGGSYNRLIGLTHRREAPEEDHRYVLRIPRFLGAANVCADAAALLFVQRYTTIAIPKVVQIDGTNNNALDSPFMVQHRLQGQALTKNWSDLSHQQKCKLAQELGSAYRKMLAVRSRSAGTLVLPEDDTSPHAAVFVLPLKGGQNHPFKGQKSPSELALPFNTSPQAETAKALLLRMVQELKVENGAVEVYLRIYARFERMIDELTKGGWLDKVHFSLAHLDLFPRNVHTDPTTAEGSPVITGILDWDSAILAPAFVTCQPPQWLWEVWHSDSDTTEDGDEEDESTSNDEPPTPEAKELKILFEEAAGETYMRFAYDPVYRHARCLFKLILFGLGNAGGWDRMLAMLRDWRDVYGGYDREDDWVDY